MMPNGYLLVELPSQRLGQPGGLTFVRARLKSACLAQGPSTFMMFKAFSLRGAGLVGRGGCQAGAILTPEWI